jgi:hypothetical protein
MLSKNSGSLNLPDPYWPVKACNGIRRNKGLHFISTLHSHKKTQSAYTLKLQSHVLPVIYGTMPSFLQKTCFIHINPGSE